MLIKLQQRSNNAGNQGAFRQQKMSGQKRVVTKKDSDLMLAEPQ